ncbi:MAG: hypothetical protein RLZ32_2937 [Gemmatimonadota bacterium]|jgi:hypothetical protein
MIRPSRHDVVPGATTSRQRAGFALESVLMVLVLFTVVVLAGLSTVSTVSRTSGADYQSARATYAAEGAGDDIMAQLDAAMQDGRVTADEVGALETPVIPGFTVTKTVAPKGEAVLRTVATGPFAGLYSMNQPFDITMTARDSTGARASAVIAVNTMSVPIFQFAVFYEQDMDLHPGPPMVITGRVHSNGNLYLSNNLTLAGVVTTPESTFKRTKRGIMQPDRVRIKDADGNAVLLDQDSRTLGGDAAFRRWSEERFDGRLMAKPHGVRPLKLPLPASMPPRTLLEPRADGDAAQVRSVKMAWKADWYITVRAGVFAMADTNAMKAAFCDSLVHVRPPGLQVPSTADCRRIFKPRVNAFMDGREDRRPDLVDIHMDSLRLWSDANPAARSPRVLYVAFAGLPAGANGDFPAIRLRQARQLPVPRPDGDEGGLTIATAFPMYLLGDYNSEAPRPAALMSDAIITLSNPPNVAMSAATSEPAATRCGASGVRGWCDNQQQSKVKRRASGSSVHAAVLGGHTAIACDGFRPGCGAPPSGGGVQNMMGYRENWAGATHRYRGSIVSLFTHQYLLKGWNLTFFSPPIRDYSFDTRFESADQLPPGTPAVGNVVQTAFRPLY